MFWDPDAIGRIAAAVALGALIGIERESMDQPAGLRTHISVCLGACLFGVVSTLGFDEFRAVRGTTNFQVDVTRVASQVVVGIGFLGAGIIYRQGVSVKNVTTAASLWVVAAIGLACGVGDIGTATTAAIALVVALVGLRIPRALIRRRVVRDQGNVRFELSPDADPHDLIGALRATEGVEFGSLLLEKEEGAFVIRAEMLAKATVDLPELLGTLAHRDDVVSLRIDG